MKYRIVQEYRYYSAELWLDGRWQFISGTVSTISADESEKLLHKSLSGENTVVVKELEI